MRAEPSLQYSFFGVLVMIECSSLDMLLRMATVSKRLYVGYDVFVKDPNNNIRCHDHSSNQAARVCCDFPD